MKEKQHKNAFWIVGLTLLMVMVGTNLPSPLYEVYKERWDFSSGLLAFIFSTYALVLIPTLLLFGQLSDRFGRKKIVILGLFTSILGSILFIFSNNIEWLFFARALQGLSVGIISGAATAALSELNPFSNKKIAALIASISTAAGTAIGPAISGVIAEYTNYPTTFPYVFHLIVVLPLFFSLWFIPETIQSRGENFQIKKPKVPSNIKVPFFMGGITAFLAWSVTALYMSLIPSYVSNLLGINNLAFTGGVVFLMLIVSVIAQILFNKTPFTLSMRLGLVLLCLGLFGLVTAVPMDSIFILTLSTIITGIGQGFAFMGSLALVNDITPDKIKGDVMSSMYVMIYTGVGVPVLGIGYLAQETSLFNAIVVFTIFVAIVTAIIFILMATVWKMTCHKAIQNH
ncbi:MFS transporter [Bacillus sp. WMMC1349]|uniref:MFS transporter n=1 Tax=Bacillus sp. WMMC1349 TaxID=2736254 RepID=UPI00155416E1|nr:MFS transporter [Bacillus sp. WMMC1349]NPC91578.1 MFS transporter [Bacillus sp. WMMC1349]